MVREVLKIYNSDGTQFHDIELHTYEYEAQRMGMPTITATIYYDKCLDDEWNGLQYVTLRGEQYFIRETPDSTKDTETHLYKHEVTFRSGREVLSNVYFYDVVPDHASETVINKYRSESTTVHFYGTIYELAERINCALLYAKVGDSILNTKTNLTTDDTPVGDGYCCMVDTLGEGDLFDAEDSWNFEFDDSSIADAINSCYETCEVPFEYHGKKIIFGASTQPLSHTFEYGAENELISVKKSNANNKVINRITFKGSEDNIPHYYPNDSEYGTIELHSTADNKVITQDTLTINKESLLGRRIGLDNKAIFCKGQNDYYHKNDFTVRIFAWWTYGTQKHYEELDADYWIYNIKYSNGVRTHFYLYFPSLTPNEDDEPYTLDLTLKLARLKNNYGSGIEYMAVATLADCNFVGFRYVGESSPDTEDSYTNGKSYDSCVDFAKGTISNITQEGAYMLCFTIDPTLEYGTHPEMIAYDSGAFSLGNSYTTTTYYYYWAVGNKHYMSAEKLGFSVGKTLNDSAIGDSVYVTYDASELMTYQSYLMPPKYRETQGAERFYNALNNTYIDPDTGRYYNFPNPYVDGSPNEYIFEDEDIKPTIEEVTNTDGNLLGEIIDIAYDVDDSDELKADVTSDSDSLDSENYVHSFFYVKLNIFNGDYGFNLFDAASQTDSMTLQMISGNCNGCKFKVQATQFTGEDGYYYYKNPVQVKNENGDIVDGSYSEKVNENNLQDFQQDTSKNSIWICLQKDVETFGVILPNATNDYKPQIGDKFNIINIDLPKPYILAAEKRGEEEMLRYMADNNEEKFTFDIEFSRIFFAENPDILEQLDENSQLNILYNGKTYKRYVTSFKISVGSDVLPEVSVDLDEELSVGESFVESVAERASSLIANAFTLGGALSSGSGGMSAALARSMFLSKTDEDSANGHITFINGLTSTSEIKAQGLIRSTGGVQFGKSYVGGLLGVGGKIDANGNAELRTLKVWESLEVPELRYNSVSVNTGIQWQTFGAGLIQDVEIDLNADGSQAKTGTITLKLEEGQIGAVALNDICMGIFHDFIGSNETENSDDKHGNFTFAGFNTVYFIITKITADDNSQFTYRLRDGYNVHPSSQMYFACYANPGNTDRQWCKYSTPEYEIRLRDMTTWTFDEANIYQIEGKLDGFTLSGKEFHGVGSVFGNAYIYGNIEQFKNAPLKLNVEVVGNNTTVADGEHITIKCTLTQGYNDVTDTVESWSIVRTTSDSESDDNWNAGYKAQNFNGEINIYPSDISDDDSITSAMFTITATTKDNEIVTTSI